MKVSKWCQNVHLNYAFNSRNTCVCHLQTDFNCYCLKFVVYSHSIHKSLTLRFQLTQFQLRLCSGVSFLATSTRLNNTLTISEQVPVLLYKNCSRFVVRISDRNILSFFGSVSFDRGSILGQRAQGQHSPSVTTTQSCKTGACRTGKMSLSPIGAEIAL